MKVFVQKLSTVLGVLATLATVAMMVAIVTDVASRAIAGKSVPGLIEFSETALVAAVFLGLAYTGATNGHIAVDLLTERLPKRVSLWLIAFGWVMAVIVIVWMIYGSVFRAIDSYKTNESRMGLVNWSLWPARWIIVVGLTAMLLVAIVNVVRTVSGREVLGHTDFEFVATDTKTFTLAGEERADLMGIEVVNEAVAGDLPEPKETKEQNHG